MSRSLPIVCFFQAYNRPYIRSETLLRGLRAAGIAVVPCQCNRRGVLRYPVALGRFLATVRRCDVVLANFRSFELLWFLRLVTRKPIVYDAHISIWQSACEERRWFRPYSFVGRLLYRLDRLNATRLADHVLIESKAQREYFIQTFGVAPERISAIYVSCEDEVFRPHPPPASASVSRVFWAGSGIPLQGLDVILEASGILAARGVPVQIRIAGDSKLLRRAREEAAARGLSNIEFLGSLSRDEVVREIAETHVGLGGHYSTLPKASIVMPGKAFEIVAMRRPVVLGDSPATRELFTHGKNAWLCRMGSAEALADAVAALISDPQLADGIAAAGYELYRTRLQPPLNCTDLISVLCRLGGGEKRVAEARSSHVPEA